MHVHNEHHLNSTKTWMKHMFASHSKTTPPDELSVLSTSAQPESLASNEDVTLCEDTNRAQRCPTSGFHETISDHCFRGVEDDELPPYPSLSGKLTLAQLFNFQNHHWADLFEECAKKSYEEELAWYDLLNEDSAKADSMEVDVDETTADILLG
ncbi:hypothetical protein BJ322DRAFT_1114090 [Thelephora terrestris]|uniref:Uncharacterized protein n=1 Tax=Thelephora terrestris TaxID=56493 RepID=A0A9P6H430_9AGAM|nr:hypothetical protein BJ322DRAFT_1114090 [Thelephora terrestris]